MPDPLLSRRDLLLTTGGTWITAAVGAAEGAPTESNLAPLAATRSTGVAMRSMLQALNSGFAPRNSRDRGNEIWTSAHGEAVQWVEYRWPQPVRTARSAVYWGVDPWENVLPLGTRLLYWDGSAYQPVPGWQGLATALDGFNTTSHEPVSTTQLRLELVAPRDKGVGILQWQVWSHGAPPDLPDRVEPGVDRSVVVGGASYLSGRVFSLAPAATVAWRKVSGPGAVRFEAAERATTRAWVDRPDEYELELATRSGRASLRLRAEAAPAERRLDEVVTRAYQLTSPLWQARARSLVVNWIPHCIRHCERTDLPEGQGGIDNFVEAGKALRGEPHAKHLGYVFSNAWVLQTVEAICLGLMVDAQGDAPMLAAQAQLRATLERWIPLLLSAQHPDGYLQTAYTLAARNDWPERWWPQRRDAHEGYIAGYFIEAAINHHTLTGGSDRRLFDAALRMADCWVANIGPGRKTWYDGHQQLEQALVRFGRYVNDVERAGRGDAYVALARFLLECRGSGTRYDQSHLPVRQQYDAVGHAVRAVYQYSAMADVAAETADPDYQSAVLSLCDNLVNRKYYLNGGVGSGDTSEGFGDDYALRHDGYSESCSSCGLVFFQSKLQRAHRDARYANLLEETLYNALLGAVDLEGRHFTYTNPLLGSQRYRWHSCPCCVGNIPRTLLMLPSWTYAKDTQGLFVNLFVGSRVQVGKLGADGGTDVEMVQDTRYPWDGAVQITVNPRKPVAFALHVRVPNRQTSALYAATPAVGGVGNPGGAPGLRGLRLNGQPLRWRIERGYAVIRRRWQAGDRLEFELPMPVQRVTADPRVAAARGQVALRRGPLVYNVEQVDQSRIDLPLAAGPVQERWSASLLGGVVSLHGRWADGSPLTAVPHFARMNREPGPAPEFPSSEPGHARSRVWLERG